MLIAIAAPTLYFDMLYDTTTYIIQHNLATTPLLPTIRSRSRPRRHRRPRPGAPQTLQGSMVPAQTHPPIWPELAASAEPRGRLCKEGSLRKRIAKYAKPLTRPKLRAWAGADRVKADLSCKTRQEASGSIQPSVGRVMHHHDLKSHSLPVPGAVRSLPDSEPNFPKAAAPSG